MMNIDFDINSVTAWAMEEQALHAMSEKMARVDVNAVLSSEDFQALILDRETRQQEGKAYRVTDGTAFIEIDGPLMKRASGFMSFLYGASSMERIGRAIEAALDDSDVERVCLLIDSPGGTVDGTAALARLVFEARGRKPILSFCHGEIMSAAIWIGTAADAVVLDNETVISGSIGVRGPTHFDMTGMAKKDGVKVEEFYKGKFKSVGSRWTPMTNEGRAHIQGVIDPINAAFVGDVAKHRGVSEKMVLSKMADARLFNGSQGIAVGLVDAVMPLSQALEQFKAGKSFKSTTQAKGVQTMDLEAKITELETKLETKATEIADMKTEHATALAAKQSELDTADARIETLETSESTLSDEIKDLKAEVEANQPFVAIGKTAIEGVRANIRTVSAQVEGTDFDAAITDTQIAAFGNDHVALAKLETKVKAQRDKMFKSGDLKPDENTSNDDTSSEQDQFALGQSIGKAHGGNVVQMRQ